MYKKISQDNKEITALLGRLREIYSGRIESYLEIGSYAGESLAYVADYLRDGAKVVLVDLGDNPHARQKLEEEVKRLRERLRITLITGDSTDPEVICKVYDECPETGYDFCLIDACHDYDYVLRDISNYGPVSTYVVMHDIDPRAIEQNIIKHGYEKLSAAHAWQVIKLCRDTEEFINLDSDKPRGLGLVRGISIGTKYHP